MVKAFVVWILTIIIFPSSLVLGKSYLTNITATSINIKSFSGDFEYNTNTLYLSWETSAEENSYMFILQRSEDMETFEDVCIIKAAGNTGATTAYNCTDVQPLRGLSFYRLKLINKDKSEIHSDIINMNVVYPENQEASFIIPNPNDGMFRLLLPSSKNNVEIKILDEMGQIIKMLSITNNEPNFYASLDLRDTLAKGKYYVIIDADESQHVKKMRVVNSW